MDKKARAEHAQRLLNDDTLKNAFDVVSEYHAGKFSDELAEDREVLEARRDYLALERVKAQLHSFVMDGKILDKRTQDRGSD